MRDWEDYAVLALRRQEAEAVLRLVAEEIAREAVESVLGELRAKVDRKKAC